MRDADIAMYLAKDEGGARGGGFDERLSPSAPWAGYGR